MAKILIVDDALFMRQVIRGILRDGGYDDLLEAEDGETAAALCRNTTPDLVLLDVTMPGIDGVETLRMLRVLRPETKVVMCSAVGQEKLMIRAITLGASDYIVKPFKQEELLRVVAKALS